MLLLDETTSHLDVRREKAVSASIRGISLTRIFVAHRPQTLRSADRVISIENGKIMNDLKVLVDAGSDAEPERGFPIS